VTVAGLLAEAANEAGTLVVINEKSIKHFGIYMFYFSVT
jgi:hypothetical protein